MAMTMCPPVKAHPVDYLRLRRMEITADKLREKCSFHHEKAAMLGKPGMSKSFGKATELAQALTRLLTEIRTDQYEKF
jgi:hypothetical protein